MSVTDFKQVCDTLGSTEGPFKHVLFLGLSVQSVTASMGWNSQQSTVTINLVEDDCPPPQGEFKYYYPRPGIESRWGDADPGWTNPTIGAPCYFRLGDFEFAGLLQNWEKKQGAGGFTYVVTLCDPRLLLENVSVIISDYADSIDGGANSTDTIAIENLINAYGWAESQGFDCDQYLIKGASFGSPAGGFGGSLNNSEGTPFNIIKKSIMYLLAQPGPVQENVGGVVKTFSAGSARFRGHNPLQFNTGGGMGALDADSFDARLVSSFGHNGYISSYVVDISEIPFAPEHFRLAGPQDTLMNIISNACTLAGCDFFVDLLISGTTKVIKIRTTQRRIQPSLGEIEAFIATTDGVTEKNIGRELRNETNSSFLYGGYIQSIYEDLADNPISGTDIIQHWGFDGSGNFTPATLDVNDEWDVTLDLRPLVDGLNTPLTDGAALAKKVIISEREMRCALGEYDTWRNYILAFNNKAGTPMGILIRATFPGVAMDLNPEPFEALAVAVAAPGLGNDGAAGVVLNDPANQKLTTEDTDDLKKIHKFVADFADEYYGKQFLLRLPFVCYRDDEESGQRMLSDNPTNDGGWPAAVELQDETDPSSPLVPKVDILGLAWPPTNALPEIETFRDDVGKVHSFVRFDTAPTGAYPQNHDNFVVFESGLYVKSQLDEKVYEYPDGNACAVLKINQAIAPKRNEEGVDKRFAGFLEIGHEVGVGLANKVKIKAAIKFLADKDQAGIRGDTALAMETKRLIPSGAAVPMISNTDRYGPYYQEGPPGQVKFEAIGGLTPWNYNGYDAMDAAGVELVKDSVTYMQVGEKGGITIPGYPVMRLGQELRDSSSSNPNFSFGMFGNISLQIDNSLAIAGSTTSYGFQYYNTSPMAGTFGPNITDISISMGTNGVTTSYSFRTFSPTFGKFAKYNAAQLQKVSKRRQEIARRNRLDDKVNKRLAKAEQRVNKALANIKRENDAKNVGPGAPVVITAQQSVPAAGTMPGGQPTTDAAFNDMVTIEGGTSTARQVTNCPPDPNGALMSWDGLFYPVSRSGDGGLSPYVTPVGSCSGTKQYLSGTTTQMDPPITGYSEPIVNTSYLDPFAVPSTPKHENDPTLEHHSGNHHHVRRIAHSDYSASGGTQTNMRVGELTGDAFPEDFRFLALKGPLLIHGWGYDLEGKPIPNYADTTEDASQGVFHNGPEDLEDHFLPMWLRKPQTWPTAPLDVRFDRARGVWTVPNDFRIMQAQVVQSGGISAGETGAIQILNLRPTYDEFGDEITDPEKKRGILSNPSTIDCIGTLASGDTFFTFYDTIDCLYYPIPCSSGVSGCTVIYNSGCDNDCGSDNLDCAGTRYDPYVYVYGTGITASFIEMSGLTGCVGCETGSGTLMMTGTDPTGYVNGMTGIMINLDLKVSDSGYCDWSGIDGTPLDCYNFDHIIFRSGLQAREGEDCEVIIDADHCIHDSGYCDWSGSITGEEGDTLAGGFFNHLVAGSGLQVVGSGSGGCTYTIHADHYIKAADHTGCLSGVSEVEDYEFFNKLAFRSGMTVTSGDNCEYYIDAVPHRVADSGYCEYKDSEVSFTGCTPFDCLTFRSGLKVVKIGEGEEDCDFLIDADHTLSKITCTEEEETIEPAFFNHLTFYTGIDVELSDDDCSYLITSALTIVDIEPTGDCTGTVPTLTIPAKYEALRFGSGLTVTGEGCEYTIHARQPCIADSGYCDWAPVVPDCEIFDELNAGSGLRVAKVGDCQYQIEADHYINDTSYCDWTATVEDEFFTNLNIGTGLKVNKKAGDGCQYNIDADHYLKGTDYCSHLQAVDTYKFFNKLNFTRGLQVTSEGACEYTIKADHYISKIDCDDTESLAGTFFNMLTFHTGIDVEHYGSCEYGISSALKVQDIAYCDWTPVAAATPKKYENLYFGTGLKMFTYGECGYSIDADHYIQGTDYCDHTQGVDSYEFFNKLNFTRGLQVTSEGDCEYTIKADHYISKVDCEDTETLAPTFFNQLTFWTGFDVEAGNNCEWLISSAFTIVDIEPSGDCSGTVATLTTPVKYEALRFGSGLSVTGSGCEYTIHARQPCIADSGYCDWSPTVTDCGIFDELNAGSGLRVAKVGDCQYQIEADHYINDASYCNWVPTVEDEFFTKLNIGTGLRVNKQAGDGCQYNIDADHYIKDTATCGRGSNVVPYKFFNRINFQSGLYLVDEGECQYSVQADHHITDAGYCDHTGEGGTPAVQDDFFRLLTFGTGLKVVDEGNCEFAINADHYISSTGSTCSGTESITKKFFNHLSFGSGIGVKDKGNCAYEIFACGSGSGVQVRDSGYCDWEATPERSGCTDVSCITYGSGLKLIDIVDGEARVDADHYIHDSGYCDYTPSVPGPNFFNNIIAGTGLKVISSGDCSYRIDADHYLSSVYTDCDGTEAYDHVFFNHLKFMEGIGVNKVDDCEYEIYACGNVKVKDSNPCTGNPPSYTSVVTDCSGLTCLEFGSGLHIYDSALQPKVMATRYVVDALDSGTCKTTSYNPLRAWYETLHFRKGVHVQQSGTSCEYIVDVVPHKYKGDTTCAKFVAALAPPVDQSIDSVFAGPGISIRQDEVDECGYAIGTEFWFNSCSGGFNRPINKFEYGCGIVAVETPGDSCSVDISLDPLCGGGPLFGGLATGVNLVRDVCCTGDSLTINYVTLMFSSCGLFTGIVADDGLCDCCE